MMILYALAPSICILLSIIPLFKYCTSGVHAGLHPGFWIRGGGGEVIRIIAVQKMNLPDPRGGKLPPSMQPWHEYCVHVSRIF